jgi:hypothetical protein
MKKSRLTDSQIIDAADTGGGGYGTYTFGIRRDD